MCLPRLLCASTLALSTFASHAQKPLKQDEVLLFAYFKGNGEDGLHLATSPNGWQWTALHQAKSRPPPATAPCCAPPKKSWPPATWVAAALAFLHL